MLAWGLSFIGSGGKRISGRIGRGSVFHLGGGVRCGRVRRGGVGDAQHQWAVVTTVHLVADDTIADILYQTL